MDYSVTFDDSGDEKKGLGNPPVSEIRAYQKMRVEIKSGEHREVSPKYSDTHLNYFAVLAAEDSTISSFLVTAYRCCGSTGMGGPGKLIKKL